MPDPQDEQDEQEQPASGGDPHVFEQGVVAVDFGDGDDDDE